MNNLFNKNLLNRLISVFVFVPLIIIPIIISHYMLLIIYLIINAIILLEINSMKKRGKIHIYFNIFILISTSSFFLFIFLIISNSLSNFEIISIIIVIWMFDTFSFLGGKIIGGTKLMPSISSGKTISGLITGVMMTSLLIVIFNMLNVSENNHSILLTFMIIFFAFSGDIMASLLKRHAGVKDSGTIMPGHGGLYDRFDSFILVFFIFGIATLIL